MVTKKPTAKLTYEDYEKTSDDERYELIDGELIALTAPDRDHQGILLTLAYLITDFLRQVNNLGRLYAAPRDVYLSDTDIVQPDLLFISNKRLVIDTERPVRGAPDLVVEVPSPSTANRDWTTKRQLYARHGVKEYWIVDPDARTVTLMLLTEDSLDVSGVLGEGDTLESSVLAGFSAGVTEIFRSVPV